MIAGFKPTSTMSEKTRIGFLFCEMAKKTHKNKTDAKLLGNCVYVERLRDSFYFM